MILLLLSLEKPGRALPLSHSLLLKYAKLGVTWRKDHSVFFTVADFEGWLLRMVCPLVYA